MTAFGFVDEKEKRQCPIECNRVLVERNWMSIVVLQCFNTLLYQSRALSWGKQKLPLPTVPNDCTSKGFPSLWQCSLIPGPHRAFSSPGPTPWPATGSPLTPATHMKAPSALWPATFTSERELIMERLERKWGDRGELTDVEGKAVGHCCLGEVVRCLFKPNLGWKGEVCEWTGQRPVEDSRPGERVNQGTRVKPSVEKWTGVTVVLSPASYFCKDIATLENPSLNGTPRWKGIQSEVLHCGLPLCT